MEPIRSETENCCCGASQFQELFTARDFLCGFEGQWKIVRCASCALVRTYPRPDADQLPTFYPTDYHPHTAADPPTRATSELIRRAILAATKGYPDQGSAWWRLPATVVGAIFWKRFMAYPSYQSGGRLLDVGCGGGFQLAQFRDHGWTVTGLDVSAAAVERVRERGIEAILGTIDAPELHGRQFDVVTLFASLEHVPDPHATLVTASRLLRSGGELIIVVPRADGWLARLAGPHWFALDAPRHLYHFTPATLGELLVKVGFRVREIRSFQPPEHLSFSWIYWARRSKSMEGNPLVASRAGHVASRLLAGMVEFLGAGDSMVVRANRTGS